MPPPGLSRQSTIVNGTKYQRLTYYCPVDGCWYVCTPRDENNLEEILKTHANGLCPEPPRREYLPSGLSEVEKLWREVDDVMNALMSHSEYRDMSGDALRAYAKGLAFSIVMKDREFFPDIKSVAKEGAERWKMRNDKLPYRPTPTRHQNNFKAFDPSSGWVAAADTAKPAAPKATPTKAAPSVRKPSAKLPAATETTVRAALASGILQPEEIASMYNVPVEAVRGLAG